MRGPEHLADLALINQAIISLPDAGGGSPGIELVSDLTAMLHSAGLGIPDKEQSCHPSQVLSLFSSSVKEEQGVRLSVGVWGQNPHSFFRPVPTERQRRMLKNLRSPGGLVRLPGGEG